MLCLPDSDALPLSTSYLLPSEPGKKQQSLDKTPNAPSINRFFVESMDRARSFNKLLSKWDKPIECMVVLGSSLRPFAVLSAPLLKHITKQCLASINSIFSSGRDNYKPHLGRLRRRWRPRQGQLCSDGEVRAYSNISVLQYHRHQVTGKSPTLFYQVKALL